MHPTSSVCPELTRLLVCVAAVALLLPLHAAADPPEPDGPSAKQIVGRMAKAYADCKSYRDSGVVTTLFVQDSGNRTVDRPFITAFVRPGRFRFEYTDKSSNQQSRYIIWSNGQEVQTWWDIKPGVQKPESLGFAVGVAAGVSGGSSNRIPGMLMPDMAGGGIHISVAERIEDGNLGTVECFRLEGKYVNNPITLWIDKKSYLVRRIDEQAEFDNFHAETTTTYDPFIDEKIADNLLEFSPPCQDDAEMQHTAEPSCVVVD